METIGKYQVLGLLGQGAMGIVYKALDPDINRNVAIKVIRFDRISEEGEKTEIIRRFIREAQAAGKLVHPNIITIYDVGRVDDLTYIVMQIIEGRSLKKALAGGMTFSPGQVIPLMTQLCEALDYAHTQGIVHRDIKPANILLDKAGKPYILDFGVARIEMSTLTQSGSIVGTPSYMAPEQVMGKKIDTRADIFSLGVMLYEMLTGKRPFEGDHITTVVYKIIHEEPPDIHTSKKGLPPGFGSIIKKALEKDPERRYQNCRELARDLALLDAGEEATLSLSGFDSAVKTDGSRSGKRGRRKNVLIGSAAILLLVFVGFYLFILPGFRDKGEVKAMSAAVIKSPPPEKELPAPDISGTKIGELDGLFAEGKYEEVIQAAREELKRYPSDEHLLGLISESEVKLKDAAVSAIMSTGNQEFRAGRYQKCIQRMNEVLQLDPGNAEAQQMIARSLNAVARGEITRMIERHRIAEEGKDLLAMLSYYGLDALIETRKNEARDFFNLHDDIKSFVSDITVEFPSETQSMVSYQNLVSAVLKQTGQRKIIFEGRIIWTVEKKAAGWKIVDYQRRSL